LGARQAWCIRQGGGAHGSAAHAHRIRAGARQAALRLSGPIQALVTAAVHVTPQAVFVGLNAGEWGGGLKRIDRRSGGVETIERNTTGGLCDGPLNTDCDPVQGLRRSRGGRIASPPPSG
jgi:hypothetical protein